MTAAEEFFANHGAPQAGALVALVRVWALSRAGTTIPLALDEDHLLKAAQARARRERIRAQERERERRVTLLELHGMTSAKVRQWARLLRLPLPVDGTLPTTVIEYVLLVSRHHHTRSHA